ncbi:hypothetical protein [Glaciecola sp. 1036]|uniref:hypothetical protein n=1 Tax=Alteromonadaceae TaxID=72275 RepID=UPI003D08E782
MLRRLSRKLQNLQGIKQWSMEFIIVVFGVLLALWTQEWVKQLNDKETADIIAEAMDQDLLFMATGTMRRFSAQPCMLESLKNLATVVKTPNGEAFVKPPIAKATDESDAAFNTYYPVPLWSYYTRAFDRAIATGAFDHMSIEKVELYGEAYGWVVQMIEIEEAEDALTSRLAMVEMIELMDESTRLTLSRDIAALNGLNASMLNSGRFLFESMNKLGLRPSEENIELWHYINKRSQEVRGDCVQDFPLDFTGKYTGKSWTTSVN